MKKRNQQELNFRFHNPNSDIATVDLILSVFMEVQKKKADEAINKDVEKVDEEKTDT